MNLPMMKPLIAMAAASFLLAGCASTAPTSGPSSPIISVLPTSWQNVANQVLAQCGWLVPVADIAGVAASGIPVGQIVSAICTTFGPKASGQRLARRGAAVVVINGVLVHGR